MPCLEHLQSGPPCHLQSRHNNCSINPQKIIFASSHFKINWLHYPFQNIFFASSHFQMYNLIATSYFKLKFSTTIKIKSKHYFSIIYNIYIYELSWSESSSSFTTWSACPPTPTARNHQKLPQPWSFPLYRKRSQPRFLTQNLHVWL